MNPKQQQLQAQRLKTTTMTVVSSLLQVLLIRDVRLDGQLVKRMMAFVWFCRAERRQHHVLLRLAVRQGWNLRYKDRWLLWAQLLANYVIQLIFIVAAPKRVD